MGNLQAILHQALEIMDANEARSNVRRQNIDEACWANSGFEHEPTLGVKIQLFTTCFHVKTKATSCQKMEYITSYNIITIYIYGCTSICTFW
jgi:hypothetical protein